MSSDPEIRRSASGARQAGDEYQHLVAWNKILMGRHDGLIGVELEAVGAGNADDVVIHFERRPSEYAQVRYAVDGNTPVNLEYLTESKPNGTSVFQKFLATSRELPGGAALMLVTNRAVDGADPILTEIDGRTGLVVPALAQASPRSALGQARASLCEHLGITVDELLEFASRLQFRVGRQYQAELDLAQATMAANGLRNDPKAIRRGIDLVRQWVLEGRRELSVAQIADALAQLAETGPSAVLLVQALDYDPTPENATENLEWVEYFEGDSPGNRRATIADNTYQAHLQPQLEAAGQHLVAAGHHRVFVRGKMRLATWFAVGATLQKVHGIEVACQQGPAIWRSDTRSDEKANVAVANTEIGHGDDTAVVVAMSADADADVVEYVTQNGLPIGRILALTPKAGAADDSVLGDTHAVAIVQAARGILRQELRGSEQKLVHLFLACPGGLALFLGHRWNRVAPVCVYEDLRGSYQPAFTFAG